MTGVTQHYIGNGFCDDGLNKAECNFDGGDCCNPNASTDYCTFCQCLDPDHEDFSPGEEETTG